MKAGQVVMTDSTSTTRYRKDTFGSHLWCSAIRIRNGVFAGGGFVLAFLGWIAIPVDAALAWHYVIPLFVLVGIGMAIFYDAAQQAFVQSRPTLPEVLRVQISPRSSDRGSPLLLLEPSILFSHDALVSIYLLDDGFERLIGFGFVINVQEDDKIQIVITKPMDQTTWERITNNDAKVLEQLRVKPNVPSRLLENFEND